MKKIINEVSFTIPTIMLILAGAFGWAIYKSKKDAEEHNKIVEKYKGQVDKIIKDNLDKLKKETFKIGKKLHSIIVRDFKDFYNYQDENSGERVKDEVDALLDEKEYEFPVIQTFESFIRMLVEKRKTINDPKIVEDIIRNEKGFFHTGFDFVMNSNQEIMKDVDFKKYTLLIKKYEEEIFQVLKPTLIEIANSIKSFINNKVSEAKNMGHLNLFLLEIQEPELAQELRENVFKNLKSKFHSYRKCSIIKTNISYLQNNIEELTRNLEQGLSPRYKEELNGYKRDLAKEKADYKKFCTKPNQEHQVLEAGFESKPKGWTDKSIQKAGKTIARHVGEKSPKDKNFFDKCVAKMRGKIRNPEGYCAALKDEAHGSTFWRGKDKTKKEAEKDVARHQNV